MIRVAVPDRQGDDAGDFVRVLGVGSVDDGWHEVPVQTLYQWRRKGFGPQARRVGKHLRWDPTAIRTWFDGLDQ